MTAPVNHEVDVVIVGAGPVGLTLANFLGLYGVSALVLERLESLIDYPRGVGMDDECLRVFQSIGVVDDVLPHTTPDQWLRFVNGKGRCYASIEPRRRDFGWPRRNAFIQPLVDQVLLDGIRRFDDVSVAWSCEVVGIDEHADGVSVSYHDHAADRQGVVAARFIVGCDGGRSFVRKHMGVSWDGTSSPTRWLVVDIENDPVGTPNAYVYGDWRRPYVSIALPHGVRRFEFMVLPGEDEDQISSPESVAALIHNVVPGIGTVDAVRRRVYTHHARVAGAFVRGRVLIAGDAAHLMPVWQGQGYNSGIRDAANLGWKLAAHLRGLADQRIVATYDIERRGHASAMVRISQTAGLLVRQTNRWTAGLRDAITRAWEFVPPLKRYIVEMRYKPMPRYVDGIVVKDADGALRPAVGRLFVQPTVVDRDGASRRLDDVLGPWFAVVGWGEDPRTHLSPAAVSVWEMLGARFVAVRPSTQLDNGTPDKDEFCAVADETGALKAWFDANECSVVILRPDRFVTAAGRPLDLSAQSLQLASTLGLPVS